MKYKKILALILTMALAVTTLSGCSATGKLARRLLERAIEKETAQMEEINSSEETEPSAEETEEKPAQEEAIQEEPETLPEYTPCVPAYELDDSLSNVENTDRFYFQDHMKQKLVENQFLVEDSSYGEFFDLYEFNRYMQIPNFITTDSMMHTYHLYFSMLQKNTERDYLVDLVDAMSTVMLTDTLKQYEVLRGTEWEDAAAMNVIFFAVGASLMGEDTDEVPDELMQTAQKEIGLIADAEGIADSPLFGIMEDYSQYQPRGYYEGDETLEQYFRTMMWYGRCNFAWDEEIQNRASLLMTMALQGDAGQAWETVYSITSFFAGASDDAGYREYQPIIEKVYGKNVTIDDLPGDTGAYQEFQKLTGELDPPEVQSLVLVDEEKTDGQKERVVGYRFMGQRYSLDASIFTQLCYSEVKENPDGDKRMLPDALDVPAAMGSETAAQILQDQGHFEYQNYEQNMNRVQTTIADATDEFWNSSLYSSWLNTLRPVLEEKGEGYPSFMQSTEWNKKNLESFLGSYTELKHDTVLYSKQFLAEMGGGDEELDDRGYVEPEPELYDRLAKLAKKTSDGLQKYGVIARKDVENLARLQELSEQLMTISIKELTCQEITEEDYELIRCYGGSIEHFWTEVVKEQTDSSYISSQEFPAALVVDIATDPNGAVLEEAIGGISEIYVVVPVDGKLRLAKGGVFTYYQFVQPLSERLTDSKWRQMIGMEVTEDMEYQRDESITQPEWTQSYRASRIFD